MTNFQQDKQNGNTIAFDMAPYGQSLYLEVHPSWHMVAGEINPSLGLPILEGNHGPIPIMDETNVHFLGFHLVSSLNIMIKTIINHYQPL